jgi:protein-disulfide isomerase-like protein with CxxC motif
VLLQYTSKATIAGRTTCDANAFRGTLAQLTALLTGGHAVTTLDDTFTTPTGRVVKYTSAIRDMYSSIGALMAAADADATRDAATIAAIQAITTGGGNVDSAPIIAAIQAAAAESRTAVASLHDQLAAADTTIADLERRLAAAATAGAAALTSPTG